MVPAAISYLKQYDDATPEAKWALMRKFMAEDPLGFFAELRDQRPILVAPEATLVALYDDVIEMLNMPKVFTVALYEPKMSNGYLMMHDDDALHYREKSVMQSLLNRDDLPKVRAMVAKIAAGLLQDAGGHMNAVDAYCRMVPATLVRDYFGLIGMHRKDLIEWSYWAQVDTFYNQPFDIVTPEEKARIEKHHAASGEKLGKYVAALVLAKKLTSGFEIFLGPTRALFWSLAKWIFKKRDGKLHDDIVTRMMRMRFPKEMDFDLQRVGVNAGGLLIGAIEATAQATVQVMDYLLRDPALVAQAREAASRDNPAELDSIVWEALRFVPISPYVFRRTASDYTLAKGTDHPVTIPAGTNVLALTQSAMFDPKAFEEPQDFRAGRNWYHYFTFGYGSHECLGKYVGMVMIPEMVRQVFRQRELRAPGVIEYDGHMPKSFELTWME